MKHTRVAIASLRCALRRPPATANCVLTSTGESVAKNSLQDVGRVNAAYRARELPRRPYEIKRMKDGRPLGSLDLVEQVLDSMNAGMAAMTLERRVIATAGGQKGAAVSSLIRMVNSVMDEMEY